MYCTSIVHVYMFALLFFRYYGCGLVIPPELDGMKVLDLGSGAGQDCFVLSKLVGERGHVTGVDMTDEQVGNHHHHQYGCHNPLPLLWLIIIVVTNLVIVLTIVVLTIIDIATFIIVLVSSIYILFIIIIMVIKFSSVCSVSSLKLYHSSWR